MGHTPSARTPIFNKKTFFNLTRIQIWTPELGRARQADRGVEGSLKFHLEGVSTMLRMNRYLSAMLLAAAIAALMGVVASAQPQDRDDHDRSRVYDRDHKDYHNWDDREDRAYRSYLHEKHHAYREYNKADARTQREYWKWRHEHPDHD
jgi:hypothetical protein